MDRMWAIVTANNSCACYENRSSKDKGVGRAQTTEEPRQWPSSAYCLVLCWNAVFGVVSLFVHCLDYGGGWILSSRSARDPQSLASKVMLCRCIFRMSNIKSAKCGVDGSPLDCWTSRFFLILELLSAVVAGIIPPRSVVASSGSNHGTTERRSHLPGQSDERKGKFIPGPARHQFSTANTTAVGSIKNGY